MKNLFEIRIPVSDIEDMLRIHNQALDLLTEANPDSGNLWLLEQMVNQSRITLDMVEKEYISKSQLEHTQKKKAA